jgi:signal transduction histidine kinase
MRLAEFIALHREAIVNGWESVATEMPLLRDASLQAIRRHADSLLDAILGDLRAPLAADALAQSISSSGLEHGLARHAAGLSVVEMVAEFRALRAAVLRLWTGAGVVRTAQTFDDLAQFNEAIDRCIASAVAAFVDAVERDRALLLGIVAHDLRGPLQAAAMGLHVVGLRHAAARDDDAFGQTRRALTRMTPMVDDLMNVAAAGLGARLPVQPGDVDLVALATDLLGEVSREFPQHRFVLDAVQPVCGRWDAARLGQLLSNLVRNAAAHGDSAGIVRVRVAYRGGDAAIHVHNSGPPIPPTQLRDLFAPTARAGAVRDGQHLGLGLFIVQEIARAHEGSVGVESDENGTVFTVVLPLVGQPT